MSKRRKRRRSGPQKSGPTSKSPILLDQFSQTSLRQWRLKHKAAHDYQTLLYFDLEGQRTTQRQQIHDVLRSSTIPFSFRDWARAVNYRYTLHPLSAIGSLKGIGGRFNIGEDVEPSTYSSFPALYLGDTNDTALAEYFQMDTGRSNGLTREDFALTNKSAYSVVKLRGELTNIFDLRKKSNLKSFVDITKHFTISARVDQCAQIAGLKHFKVINSVHVLYDNLLDPRWRLQPMQYDVPSNSQIFGEVLCEAGIQGIIYPSTKGSGECLVVFPSNLLAPDIYVEVVPPAPAELKLTRLDWTTWRELIEE